MPFNSIPSKDFLNRENELGTLYRLFEFRRDSLSGNILLEGASGIGKSELLKQIYRTTFWEDKGLVPFYYSFRTASLKGSFFARDYFTRFITQYHAFCSREPFAADNIGRPFKRLLPQFADTGLYWLIDMISEFEEVYDNGDFYSRIIAAISAPVNAARLSGRPVLLMLDDFNMSSEIYESRPGDTPSIPSLFEESLKNSNCPHIITGSPEGILETIFSDPSLLRQSERMRLGPLPEDMARMLFDSCLGKLDIRCTDSAARRVVSLLGGNPLYIRNLAKAAWKMQKKEIGEKDALDCYGYEVSDGETAFYWSSTIRRSIADPVNNHDAIKVLMQSIKSGTTSDLKRLSGLLGLPESVYTPLLRSLLRQGLAGNRDTVFQDCVRCLYMKEVEGRTHRQILDRIVSRYSAEPKSSCFEMVIPMSENAELVAAGAAEQIGRNIDLPSDVLHSIQLAVIEACINAIEHSGSVDRKLHLKFLASQTELKIVIESSGRHFSLDGLANVPAEENIRSQRKRGWGYQLIRKVMDDVRVERIGDRTRVILTKKLPVKNEVQK